MDYYPWKDEVLPKIKNMHKHEHIVRGFQLVRAIEESDDDLVRVDLQWKHLLAIANHEQWVILQPLIYDDPDFSKWVERQRWPIINMVSPELKLAFTSACDTKDARLKSVAPPDTKLEEFSSRMKWIANAARKFHNLMQRETTYMEKELHAIAAWVDIDQSQEVSLYNPFPQLD